MPQAKTSGKDWKCFRCISVIWVTVVCMLTFVHSFSRNTGNSFSHGHCFAECGQSPGRPAVWLWSSQPPSAFPCSNELHLVINCLYILTLWLTNNKWSLPQCRHLWRQIVLVGSSNKMWIECDWTIEKHQFHVCLLPALMSQDPSSYISPEVSTLLTSTWSAASWHYAEGVDLNHYSLHGSTPCPMKWVGFSDSEGRVNISVIRWWWVQGVTLHSPHVRLYR